MPYFHASASTSPTPAQRCTDEERVGDRRGHDPREQAGRDEKRYGDEEREIDEPPRHTEMLVRRRCQRLTA